MRSILFKTIKNRKGGAAAIKIYLLMGTVVTEVQLSLLRPRCKYNKEFPLTKKVQGLLIQSLPSN